MMFASDKRLFSEKPGYIRRFSDLPFIFAGKSKKHRPRGANSRGWGSWTRTNACGIQNPVPYQLGDTPMLVNVIDYTRRPVMCQDKNSLFPRRRTLSAQGLHGKGARSAPGAAVALRVADERPGAQIKEGIAAIATRHPIAIRPCGWRDNGFPRMNGNVQPQCFINLQHEKSKMRAMPFPIRKTGVEHFVTDDINEIFFVSGKEKRK